MLIIAKILSTYFRSLELFLNHWHGSIHSWVWTDPEKLSKCGHSEPLRRLYSLRGHSPGKNAWCSAFFLPGHLCPFELQNRTRGGSNCQAWVPLANCENASVFMVTDVVAAERGTGLGNSRRKRTFSSAKHVAPLSSNVMAGSSLTIAGWSARAISQSCRTICRRLPVARMVMYLAVSCQ